MQLILKEIYKEQKNQNEIIVSFKYYLEIEVPKIVEKMKKQQSDREEGNDQ